MALTITIEGKGVIANCDSETNDTGGTGTGDWSEQGGGTMSLTNDVYLYGDSSIAGKYASKSGLQQFDLGSGNELDFDTGGNEEGQFIYMWINLATFGVLETLANKGLAIRISSSSPGTSNYKDYLIAGSDGSNGWTGGWKLFVIDPTKTASFTNGTCDIGSIRTLGVWIDTAASVRAESLFIDQIAVGKGLRITGTSTTAIKDVVDYCTDYTNRAWGMLQERDGIYYAFGKLYIGDSTNQSADVSFADSGRIIQFGTSQYYESGAWKTTFPVDASGIIIEDHASYKTDFTDGILVGTDNGRSGSVIIGNADQNIVIDLYGGNNAASTTLCYGTTFKDIRGLLNSGNDSDHKFFSCSFLKCSKFDPVGSVVIRNCVFAETTDIDASLLWNLNIDIEDSAFIANTIGAAIEHDAIITDIYTNLLFSANNNDLLNSITPVSTDSNTASYNGVVGMVPTRTRISQSFTGDGNELSNIGFFLKRVGSPTGDLTAQLWSHSGTFGTSSVPDTLIATSKIIDASLVSNNTPPEEMIFHFERGTTLVNSTKYCAVFTFETAEDTSDIVSAGREGDGTTHNGNYAFYDGSSWTVGSSYDLQFHVRTNATVQISKSGTSNPTSVESPDDTTTLLIGSVPITITVVDAANTPITTANVRVEETDGTLVSQGNVNGSGIYSASYSGSTPLTIYLVVRSSSSGEIRYFSVRTGGTIASSTGLVTTVTLQEDSIAGS